MTTWGFHSGIREVAWFDNGVRVEVFICFHALKGFGMEWSISRRHVFNYYKVNKNVHFRHEQLSTADLLVQFLNHATLKPTQLVVRCVNLAGQMRYPTVCCLTCPSAIFFPIASRDKQCAYFLHSNTTEAILHGSMHRDILVVSCFMGWFEQCCIALGWECPRHSHHPVRAQPKRAILWGLAPLLMDC